MNKCTCAILLLLEITPVTWWSLCKLYAKPELHKSRNTDVVHVICKKIALCHVNNITFATVSITCADLTVSRKCTLVCGLCCAIGCIWTFVLVLLLLAWFTESIRVENGVLRSLTKTSFNEIRDDLGIWITPGGFQMPGPWFWIPEVTGFQIFAEFWITMIPKPKGTYQLPEVSGFQKQTFSGFWNAKHAKRNKVPAPQPITRGYVTRDHDMFHWLHNHAASTFSEITVAMATYLQWKEYSQK